MDSLHLVSIQQVVDNHYYKDLQQYQVGKDTYKILENFHKWLQEHMY